MHYYKIINILSKKAKPFAIKVCQCNFCLVYLKFYNFLKNIGLPKKKPSKINLIYYYEIIYIQLKTIYSKQCKSHFCHYLSQEYFKQMFSDYSQPESCISNCQHFSVWLKQSLSKKILILIDNISWGDSWTIIKFFIHMKKF